jgi:uncharacterized protein with PIN domain
LSSGVINAKRIAPWYSLEPKNEETPLANQTTTVDDINQQRSVVGDSTPESAIVHGLESINIYKEESTLSEAEDIPRIRYLLDASLNKLCRWLRILGQDVALETDKEEKLRTGEGEMVIFDRCVKERRTLVTTSPRLIQRRDCPPNVYCIHPRFLSHLEVVLVHMLLVHGVVLEPSSFLSRCVVCNGRIVEEQDDISKRRILSEYDAPHALIDEGMKVYVCDGCQQGYWWNDRPTSSASRVKAAATRLLDLCVRGGVPVRENDTGTDGMFEHVNYKELRKEGWNYEIPGSDLLQQQLDVVEWLKSEHLICPFALESAYLNKRDDIPKFEESLPFTNVTHNFVDTLDYLFFEKKSFQAIERLYVPTCLSELRDKRSHIRNSHLLPSDVWPSDHLAIAVRLQFTDLIDVNDESTDLPGSKIVTESLVDASNDPPSDSILSTESALPFCAPVDESSLEKMKIHVKSRNPHSRRCACGCVPAILSLFEMAELREHAKLKTNLS